MHSIARAGSAIGAAGRYLSLALREALLPATCPGCHQWTSLGPAGLCVPCTEALARGMAIPYCRRCGRNARPESQHDDGRCAGCDTEPHWTHHGLAKLGAYEIEPLRQLVLGAKYRGHAPAVAALGRLLADLIAVQPWGRELDFLLPVPMHRLRRWQRPIDHTRALADVIANRLGVRVNAAALHRTRYTESQLRLASRAARLKNVVGCFEPRRANALTGKTVCIVENVVTSGATLYEVTKAARRAGAAKIHIAFAARAVGVGDAQAQADAFLDDIERRNTETHPPEAVTPADAPPATAKASPVAPRPAARAAAETPPGKDPAPPAPF